MYANVFLFLRTTDIGIVTKKAKIILNYKYKESKILPHLIFDISYPINPTTEVTKVAIKMV